MHSNKSARVVLPSDHDPALDGFRGLAILFVIWSHATDLGIPKSLLLNLEGTGRYGVFLFFVLSSFLLSRQILTCNEVKLKSIRYWTNYCLRRFLRIYPAFAITLVCYVLFHNWHPEKFPSTWPVAWSVLTLQRKASVFWTIAVEFKYYFLLPIGALLFRRTMQNLRYSTSLFVSLCLVLSILFPPKFGIHIGSYIPIFLCGTYVAVLSVSIKTGHIGSIRKSTINSMGKIALILILLMSPSVWRLFDNDMDLDTFHLWHLPFGVAWGMVLLSGVNGNGVVRNIASFKPLRLLGRISFSLYLLHMLIIGWVNVITESVIFRLAIFIPAIILISTINWYLVEYPLSRIRIKWQS
jgi:peptidoglycan/LPS O-acetylase OafA/YrhL